MIGVRVVELIRADAADIGRGINRATGDGGCDQRCVGGCAKGACHARGLGPVWPARNVICRGGWLANDALGHQQGDRHSDDRTNGSSPKDRDQGVIAHGQHGDHADPCKGGAEDGIEHGGKAEHGCGPFGVVVLKGWIAGGVGVGFDLGQVA